MAPYRILFASFVLSCTPDPIVHLDATPSTDDTLTVDTPMQIDAPSCLAPALHFTALDTVAIANSPSLVAGTAGTYEAWVLLDDPDAGSYGRLFSKWTDSLEDKDLVIGGSGMFHVYFHQGLTIDSSSPISLGRWSHVAFVFDTTSSRMYIDGTLAGMVAGAFAPANSNGPAAIGFIDRDLPSKSLLGFIQEMRISDTARYTASFTPAPHLASDANTKALWSLDEGTGTSAADASGNTNTGTITGATWMSAPCRE